MVTTVLTYEENQIISRLVSYNDDELSIERATLLTVMYTHQFRREKDALIAMLSLHPNLSNKTILEENINFYLEEKILIEIIMNHLRYIIVSDSLPQILSSKYNDAELLDLFKGAVSKPIYFRDLGIVAVGDSYTSFLLKLREAHETILLPMLTTIPYKSTIDVLLEQAERGVKIKILLANQNISRCLKGTNSKADEWYSIFKKYRNVEIRIFSDIKVSRICTSSVIDDRILTLDIYDPNIHRSSEGHMLEFRNEYGSHLNIIEWLKDIFYDAWNNARIYKESSFKWLIKSKGFLSVIAIVIFVLLYILLSVELLKGLCLAAIGYFIRIIWTMLEPILKKYKNKILN